MHVYLWRNWKWIKAEGFNFGKLLNEIFQRRIHEKTLSACHCLQLYLSFSLYPNSEDAEKRDARERRKNRSLCSCKIAFKCSLTFSLVTSFHDRRLTLCNFTQPLDLHTNIGQTHPSWHPHQTTVRLSSGCAWLSNQNQEKWIMCALILLIDGCWFSTWQESCTCCFSVNRPTPANCNL